MFVFVKLKPIDSAIGSKHKWGWLPALVSREKKKHWTLIWGPIFHAPYTPRKFKQQQIPSSYASISQWAFEYIKFIYNQQKVDLLNELFQTLN